MAQRLARAVVTAMRAERGFIAINNRVAQAIRAPRTASLSARRKRAGSGRFRNSGAVSRLPEF